MGEQELVRKRYVGESLLLLGLVRRCEIVLNRMSRSRGSGTDGVEAIEEVKVVEDGGRNEKMELRNIVAAMLVSWGRCFGIAFMYLRLLRMLL